MNWFSPTAGTPHGQYDSRLTGKRAIPLPGRTWGSGLGWGVIAFYSDRCAHDQLCRAASYIIVA
jgi:hypothetical protein